MTFQKSASDSDPVDVRNSQALVLHLHGAVGWYRRQRGSLNEVPIALDPTFLEGLDFPYVDASMPQPARPESDNILLHPSFIKNYTQEETGESRIFDVLWRSAAEALRAADEIFVIGYSLPPADSAALTLLQTSCDRDKVRVVNSDAGATRRLAGLLTSVPLQWPQSFQDWLAQTP